MRVAHCLLCAALSLAVPHAIGSEYANLKDVLIEAIDAPGGQITGRLIGPTADIISRTTQSAAPIELEVSTLKSFKQEGCKQFRIVLRQRNIQTTNGQMGIFEPIYTMNMCRNGSPPTEGMDLDRVAKDLKAHHK